MSLSDLHIHSSPHHRLRSTSYNARLSTADQSYSTAPDLSSADFNQWGHHGMSPEVSYNSHSFAHDPFDQLMEENAFPDEFGCMPSVVPEEPRQYQPGLGLDMEVDLGQAEHDLFGGAHDDVGSLGGRARTRLQSRSTKSMNTHSGSQPYPTSSPSSPARSRSGSFRVQIPNSMSLASGQSSPGSAFFPGGLPSPFRQPSTPSSATMDPAHSVRSSSPSSTSSVSGVAMSRMGSSSAASSVYGGEAGGPATPYRGANPSSGRAKHQSHSRRLSSPTKGGRNAKKLTDYDRKAICLYHRQHPTTKQDDIGARFGVERSTVSKILKLKEKWLAVPSDDEDDDPTPAAYSGTLFPSASSTSNDFISPHSTPDPSAATPQQSPPPPTPVAPSSSTMPSTSTFYLKTSSTPLISGGRYPQIDNELNSWARGQVAYARLDDETLQAKARELAQSIKGCEGFKASHTWLDGFKHRAGISGGTFLDMLSPTSRDRVKAEEDISVLGEEDEGDEVVEDQDDADFEERSTRGSRAKRQQAVSARRESSRPSTAVPPSASKVEVDSRTPLRPAFGDQDEATPTHSRATSAAAERQMFDAMYRYSPTQRFDEQQQQQQQQTTITRSSTMPLGTGRQSVHSTPSRQSSTQASPNPMAMSNYSPTDASGSGYPNYTFGDGNLPTSYSTNDLTSYPLQSPFQTSSSHSSFGQYAAAPVGSGHNSPAPSYHQHGRSGSTASTTSSYSGLTAFSQNGTGTPLTGSLYGSFPNSQSNPNSVPSTPGGGATTGYFGHGPDGTQSQLQAAFVSNQQQPTSPFPSYGQPAQPARRATISGGLPFGSSNNSVGSVALAPSLSLGPSMRNTSDHQQQQQQQPVASLGKYPVSLEQARASLETAFDYLKSAEAQGFAEPKDLLIIWELKEKMAAAHKKQQQGGSTPSASSSSSNPFKEGGGFLSFPTKHRRAKLGRTQSASSIAGLGGLYGMGSRRNGSSVSLFDSSMGVMEEQR